MVRRAGGWEGGGPEEEKAVDIPEFVVGASITSRSVGYCFNVYLGLIWYCLYCITRSHGRRAGLLSVVVVSFFPFLDDKDTIFVYKSTFSDTYILFLSHGIYIYG